jgi:hypothetical protein
VPYRLANQRNLCHFFYPAKCKAYHCGMDLSAGIDAPSNCFTYSISETVGGCGRARNAARVAPPPLPTHAQLRLRAVRVADAVQSIVDNYYSIHIISAANYGLVVQVREQRQPPRPAPTSLG